MILADLDLASLQQVTQTEYLTQGDIANIPEEFKYLSDIKMLDSLQVSNFKSFKGQHYIGPFLKFTTLIGANGSGKSSILDAILFCLSGDKLKGPYFEPKEYIARAEDQTYSDVKNQNRECWVQCQFALVGGSFIRLKRSVDTQSKSDYYIDDKQVKKKDYVSFLRSKHMIVNQTTNLAIWQGVSDMIISKEPKKVRSDLEILSGAALMREDFDKLQKGLAQVEAEMNMMTNRKERLRSDKRSMKVLKDTNDQYMKLDRNYKELLEKTMMAKLLSRQIQIRSLEDSIQKEEQRDLVQRDSYNKRKAQAQQNFKKSIELKAQVNELNLEVASLNSKLKDIASQNLVFRQQNLKDLKEEYARDLQTKQVLETKKEGLQQRLPGDQPSSVVEEYLEVYGVWQKENTILKQSFQKKQANLASLDRLIYSKQDLVQSLKEKSKKYDVNKTQQFQRVQQAQQKLTQIQKAIINCKNDLSRYATEYSQADLRLKDHYKLLQQKDTWIQELEFLVSEENEDYKQSSTNKKLQQISGYIGLIEDKAVAGNDKYAVCFELIVSSIGKYALVENEEAAQRVAARLRDLGKTKTVVILSNAKSSRETLPEMRKMLGTKAIPAMDIVNYNRQIDQLGNFLSSQLKNKIICETLQDAFQLRNMQLRGVKEIYTVGGDIVNTNGLITSHGDPSSILKNRKYLKNKNQKHFKEDIAKAREERESLKAAIKEARGGYTESELLRRQEQIKTLQNKRDDAANELVKWRDYKPNTKKVQNLQAMQEQLAELKERRGKLDEAIVLTEMEIESSPALNKFLRYHKIQSIQCFRNANNIEELEKSIKLKSDIQKEILEINAHLGKIQNKFLGQKINQLEEQLRNCTSKKYKRQLQKELEAKLKVIDNKKNDIASLKTTLEERFVSKVPELRQRLSQMTNSLTLYLENLNTEYEAMVQQPDYTTVLQEMNTTLQRVQKDQVEDYLQKIKEKRNQVQAMIGRFASFSLMNTEEGDDLGQIQKDLDSLDLNLDGLVVRRDELSRLLNEKKDARRTMFMEFLRALRDSVKKVYAFLTFGGDPPIHGTADLFVENDQNPFQSGVYYCPTPPTKRFIYEVDQLSGGQKSIACLAYQFAVAITTKSPFLILDEVDQFLDNANASRFKRLLLKMKQDHQLQCIVVSHKAGIFEESQSLVGITNHKLDLTSKAFSLML